MQQRFRSLRPLVDGMLEGYGASFLGMLEAPSDGLGVWMTEDATVSCIVTTATVPSLLKLVTGGFGSRVLDPEHTLIAVNPMWTRGQDVGQRWEGQLKEQATVLIDGPPQWHTLYHCKMVRTRSAIGMLHRAYPHGWRLHACTGEDASEGIGPLLLAGAAGDEKPSDAEVAAVLVAHGAATRGKQGGLLGGLFDGLRR
ncbi:hypothetical protein FOA52_005863 [Chlamydomonas sp. UWO 241]|nr:hypothetical protein FOA52_005863 [Chlamydomonas sp. UWO 241]